MQRRRVLGTPAKDGGYTRKGEGGVPGKAHVAEMASGRHQRFARQMAKIAKA